METTSITSRPSVWVGTLSNVASSSVEGVMVLTGTLTGTSRGVEKQTPVTVSGPVAETVKDVFVEGPFALYGRLVDGVFNVLGPDTRGRKIAKPETNKAVAAAEMAATPAKKPVASVHEGMISEIKPGSSAKSGEYLAAKLTRADGSVATLLASGEGLAKTRHLFVEGPVAIYAQARNDGKTLSVIGPDLRKSTLAAKAEQAPAEQAA